MKQPHLTRLTVGLTASVLALAGCAADAEPERRAASSSDETTSAAPASRAPRTSRSPSPEATTVATTAPPSPTAEAVTVNTSLADRLLTAAQVPGLDEQFGWQEAGTRKSEGEEPFGTCHKFAMTSIGAMRVVVREFEPVQSGGGATAAHLVADFADARTARRAMEVLKSWRGQCNEEISTYDWNEVHGLETVEAARADAGWYLLVYGPAEGGSADEGYFDAHGLTRVGKRISVLQMRSIGQDYNYPAGEEPLVEAVRAASAELG